MSHDVLALSGSLRAQSTNTALLRTAAARAPAGLRIVLHDLSEVPMFNQDLEPDLPGPVRALRQATSDAEALLLATPEYNWSLPAVLKNALDWLSRGGADAPLDRKPVGVMSAAGGSGGRRAQAHLADVLGHNRAEVVEPAVLVPRAREHVVDGQLVTPSLLAQVDALLAALEVRLATT